MTKSRALALLAVAGIAVFAVVAHPVFLDVPLIGLVVMATATVALWIGMGDERPIRVAQRFLAFLSAPDQPTSNRVRLQELLGQKAGSSSGGEVS